MNAGQTLYTKNQIQQTAGLMDLTCMQIATKRIHVFMSCNAANKRHVCRYF